MQCMEAICSFIDLEKAYDKVNRELLWNVLEEYGVPARMLDAIKGFHKNTGFKVKTEGDLGERKEYESGVRQGCKMAPILFNILCHCLAVGVKGVAVAVHASRAGLPVQQRLEGPRDRSAALKAYAQASGPSTTYVHANSIL